MTESVNWREWGEDAFRQAREQDKPILLAITAKWCHWCHVMDQVSYADERVIEAINAKLIPVRVDTDRRPDINIRYNMGGWPSTVFLTPDGDILIGGTYIPTEQLLNLINRVTHAFESQKDELERYALMKRNEAVAPASTPSMVGRKSIDHVLEAARSAYDSSFGGFGTDQKFPHVSLLCLLLNQYRKTGDESLLEMAVTTLRNMRSGGIWDDVEGGFFRYATERDWSEPHYEKMLEDNAGLLAVYTDAWRITGDDILLETVKRISNYLTATLYDRDRRLFYGTQDADEKYYYLEAEARAAVAAPSVDKTVFVNWNGQAAASYLEAYAATGDSHYKEVGIGVVHSVLDRCGDGEGCFYHFLQDDEPGEPGLLTDQSNMLSAFIHAFECTGERSYLEHARRTASCMKTRFEDASGGFFDISEERASTQNLQTREKLLDENSTAARNLIRLGRLVDDPGLISSAERALMVVQSDVPRYGILAASFALAASEFLEEPVKVSIAGNVDDPQTQGLLSSALKANAPDGLVEVREPEPDEEGPRAYLCQGNTCWISTDDPEELAEAVRSASSSTSE